MSEVGLLRELRQKTGKSDPLKGLRVAVRKRNAHSSNYLKRMMAHAMVAPGLEPDASALESIFENGLECGEFLKARRVVEAVAAAEGLTPEQLKAPYRLRGIVALRKEACLIARWLGCSYPTIAVALGYKNHTTVMHQLGRKRRYA